MLLRYIKIVHTDEPSQVPLLVRKRLASRQCAPNRLEQSPEPDSASPQRGLVRPILPQPKSRQPGRSPNAAPSNTQERPTRLPFGYFAAPHAMRPTTHSARKSTSPTSQLLLAGRALIS